MLSAVTHEKIPVFASSSRKRNFFALINTTANKFDIQLFGWVILNDHYHLLVKVNQGELLTGFFQQLHGRSAFDFNTEDCTRGRQVWHNFWDTCIRSEIDFWKRFNYIHHNQVKHGNTKKMQDWKFSSYLTWIERKGENWMADILREYPIVDYSDPSE